MKKSFLLIFFGVLFFTAGCDKIDNPYKQVSSIDLDTSLYPGNWDDYLENEYPEFSNNTNTNVNVLIEDYTGHKCNNCPPAAILAENIANNNPGRVFVASIHAGPGETFSFQSVNEGGDKYYTDHTNDDGRAYGKEFENGFNFWGNPQGTINRKTVNGELFAFTGTWESRTIDILSENNLKVNIQSVFNYFESTTGGFLHVEFEKLSNESLDLNAVVYVIQDSLVDWQKMQDNSDNEFYVHKNKHLGSIDGNPWGMPVFNAESSAGDKIILDYSYKLPQNIEKENLHFLIYVYDTDTYEILHVIKQKIE